MIKTNLISALGGICVTLGGIMALSDEKAMGAIYIAGGTCLLLNAHADSQYNELVETVQNIRQEVVDDNIANANL